MKIFEKLETKTFLNIYIFSIKTPFGLCVIKITLIYLFIKRNSD